jgi:hypothetical protein
MIKDHNMGGGGASGPYGGDNSCIQDFGKKPKERDNRENKK